MFYFLFMLIPGYTIFAYMFAYACYQERVRRAFWMGLIQAVVMTIGLGAYTWAWNVDLLLGEAAQTAQLAVALIGTVYAVAFASGELLRGDAVVAGPKVSLLDDCYFLGTENAVAEDTGNGCKYRFTREVQINEADKEEALLFSPEPA